MRKRVAGLAAAALVVVAVFAATAGAHNGTVGISCDAVTFSFTSFPEGSSTISYTVTADGHTSGGQHTISGPSDSFTVPLDLAGGVHHVSAQATWTVDGGGTATGESTIHCDGHHQPPPPPPPPVLTTTVTTTTDVKPPPPAVCPAGTTQEGTSVPIVCVRTVTKVVTKVVTVKAKTVVKWRTRTVVKWRTKIVHRTAKCSCAPGLILYRGHCAVPGKG